MDTESTMGVKQRKDGRWVVYYRARDGTKRTIYEYFGAGAEGKAAAEKRNQELGLRHYRPKKPKASGTLFFELARAYMVNKQFNPNSLRHLEIRLQANVLPFFGNRVAESIKHSDMDDYVRHRLGQGVKYSTISREITDIKAILSWSARRTPPLIPYNPIRDYVKPKADDAIVFPPSTEEIQSILRHAPRHLKRAIYISYYTGLRPGAVELLSLKWENVEWQAQHIYILSAHKGGPLQRVVDIHPEFYPLLARWHDEDKAVFGARLPESPIIHYAKRPIKSLQTTWENTLVRAGITRRIRPYDLRHSFVTRSLEDGADLKTVSEIVGSAPATIMKHYQHVSNPLRKKTIYSMAALEENNEDDPTKEPVTHNKCGVKKNTRKGAKKK